MADRRRLGGRASTPTGRSGARRVLGGTQTNCAGGPTPWGTWLSARSTTNGRVWECDPTGADAAVAHPALGVFKHEAVCVDPVEERLYLTEDVPDGCWYRFTPDAYPDLSAGLLEVATVAADGAVTWTEVPEPGGGAATPTRNQVAGATRFNGGEGTWFDSGVVYFTTKGDKKVWAYDTARCTLEVDLRAGAAGAGSALQSVDNVTVSRSGDIYVCEDGDNCEICLITPCREVAPFLRLDLDGAIHKPHRGARQRDDRRRLRPVGHADVLRRAALLLHDGCRLRDQRPVPHGGRRAARGQPRRRRRRPSASGHDHAGRPCGRGRPRPRRAGHPHLGPEVGQCEVAAREGRVRAGRARRARRPDDLPARAGGRDDRQALDARRGPRPGAAATEALRRRCPRDGAPPHQGAADAASRSTCATAPATGRSRGGSSRSGRPRGRRRGPAGAASSSAQPQNATSSRATPTGSSYAMR